MELHEIAAGQRYHGKSMVAGAVGSGLACAVRPRSYDRGHDDRPYPATSADGRLHLDQEEEPYQATPRWRDILAFARGAEAIGIDSLRLIDHFVWSADPWGRRAEAVDATDTGAHGVWEAWTTLAALAGATSRIRLGTLVTCTAYRKTALLAKMADTVDEISGGRLVLGLGAGDYPAEHRRFGIPYDRPVSRFEEALSIIVPLLRTGGVDFDGET